MSKLSLDLATVIGWALDSGQSGVVSWSDYAHDYGLLDGAFRSWLSDMIALNAVREVIVEPPVLRGASSILLVGLYWSAMSIAARHECRRRDADSNRVREHILGRARLAEIRKQPGSDGKRPSKYVVRKRLKAAVIAAMQARGHSPQDDNEADALAILAWAKEAV